MSTERERFEAAFYAVLSKSPDRPPGPTSINRELGKADNPRYRSPMNVLNGRMSVLRRQLLKDNGFVQDHSGARWRKG